MGWLAIHHEPHSLVKILLPNKNFPLTHVPRHSSMLCTTGELGEHFFIPHPAINSAAIAMLFERFILTFKLATLLDLFLYQCLIIHVHSALVLQLMV